jgi:hypothetical protein
MKCGLTDYIDIDMKRRFTQIDLIESRMNIIYLCRMKT